MLRGAATLAGAAVVGAALSACADGTTLSAQPDAMARGSTGGGRSSSGTGPRDGPQAAVSKGKAGSGSDPTASTSGSPHTQPADAHATDEDSPAHHQGGATGDVPDGTDSTGHDPDQGDQPSDQGGSGTHGSGADGGSDGGTTGDPAGPPPLIAVAAVPVGGGVVLGPSHVVVTQPVAGTFRCFGSRCTHAGCTVDAVVDGNIHCPCHGSLFDMTSGEPVAGPAQTALDSVPIKVKSGGVFLG